jgi:membrane-bound ClpP family serine protease
MLKEPTIPNILIVLGVVFLGLSFISKAIAKNNE